MFEGLVIHPHTAELLDAFTGQPAHATLLLGAAGMGKGTLALRATSHFLATTPDRLVNAPGLRHITPDEKRTISIEAVRNLQQFVRLKTTGTSTVRRVILVENADRMTTEAQNAFLKLLEEPPADTVIILTASTIQGMLPTIRSRVQTLTITTPQKEALVAHFKDKPATNVTQAYFLSGGLPGLMSALLDGDVSHPLVESVAEAKQLLQLPLFDRLARIEALAKQKETAMTLCEALARIAQAGLEQAADKGDQKRLKQWHKIVSETYKARLSFEQNANTKLTLTNLLLQF
jgi:replication-associated recombination protein RarA